MFRVYPKEAIVNMKTIPYRDKEGVNHPEKDLQLLLGKENPDGSRDAQPVTAYNDTHVAVWIKEV